MSKLDTLKQKVTALYEAKDPKRDGWCDWFWAQHVPVVAQYAHEVAKRVGANAELAEAAALLHDIADIKMARMSEQHEEESLYIARGLMIDAGYEEADVTLVVDDAIRLHSCHDGKRPKSKEGQALATADALAHLKTDFYLFALWAWEDRQPGALERVKAWALKKLDRDLNDKICFGDIREEARADYEQLKGFFSRKPAR